MPMRLNQHGWEILINDDLEWLLNQPRSLERDHIAQILRWVGYREVRIAAEEAYEKILQSQKEQGKRDRPVSNRTAIWPDGMDDSASG